MKYDENFLLICQKLGKKIKKLRTEKGITLKNMSDNTGICVRYLQKIENGKAYGLLIDRHLEKIANFLDAKLYDLLNFEK